MIQRTILFLGLGISASCLGCGPATPPETRGPAPRPEAARTIVFNLSGLDQRTRDVFERDAREFAASKMRSRLLLDFAPPSADAAAQATDIATLAAQRVAAIVVAPLQSQPLTDPVTAAFRGKTPVVVVDRPIIGDAYTSFVAADAARIGELAADWVAETFTGPVKIVELKGTGRATAAAALHDSFRQRLIDPRFRILLEAGTDGSPGQGTMQMEAALRQFAQIDVVFAHSEAVAAAAYEAAKAAGREGQMRFITASVRDRAAPRDGLPAFAAAAVLVSSGGREAMQALDAAREGAAPPRQIFLDMSLAVAPSASSDSPPAAPNP